MPIPQESVDDIPFHFLPTVPEFEASQKGFKPLTTSFTEYEVVLLKNTIRSLGPIPYLLVKDNVGIAVWRSKSGFRD